MITIYWRIKAALTTPRLRCLNNLPNNLLALFQLIDIALLVFIASSIFVPLAG